MKVLYNIAGTYRPGGMERVLAVKANYLVSKGYDVVVVTTDQRGQQAFFKLDERIHSYDLCINYEDNNGASLIKKVLQFPHKQRLHKKRLAELLLKERPDITVSMFCNDVNFLAGIKDGSKKLLEIHFSKYKRLQYGRKGLWGLADRLLTLVDARKVRKFDKFVVLTKEDKALWTGTPGICVIPNPLTLEGDTVSSLERKKAVAIGRLTPQKGFDRLVKAWAIVHRHCPEWSLDIVGDGQDKEALKKLIGDEALEDVVHLLPSVDNISEVYLNSSLYVMSSRYEGLPLVLTEAHSFGVPTVSFNCKCGPTDIIEDGVNGFLVEDGNIVQLAARIVTLMQDTDLRKRMGEAAKISSKQYSERRIMGMWTELFDNLCKL